VIKAGHKVSGRINGVPFSLFTDKPEEVFDLDERGTIIRPGPESLAPCAYEPEDT
jgi:hypothetical protein